MNADETQIRSARAPSQPELPGESALREAGHDVELISGFSDFVGHAGALVRHPNGMISGAADPRSDGVVAAL